MRTILSLFQEFEVGKAFAVMCSTLIILIFVFHLLPGLPLFAGCVIGAIVATAIGYLFDYVFPYTR